MSGSLLKILTLVTQVTFIYSSMPSINKCKLSDSSCLTSSAQMATPALAAGVPEVGSEPLDVMHIDQIKVDLAGLKMNMNDVYIRGLKKATITKVEVDMEKKQLLLSWDCDILVKSHYKASGRLLILPISGDGNSTIKLKKLHTDMIIPFELTKNPEGKDMMNLKNFRFKFDIKDNAHFDLTNLFNGNKVLSEAMLKFMNENWGLLAQEFGKPMLEKPNKKIYEAVKKFLRSQPLENIVEV